VNFLKSVFTLLNKDNFYIWIFLLSNSLFAQNSTHNEIDTTIYNYGQVDSVAKPTIEYSQFIKILVKDLRYKSSKHGLISKVIVQFVIEKDGTVSSYKFIYPERNPIYFKKETFKTIQWHPAIIDGKPVRFQYIIPMHIHLN